MTAWALVVEVTYLDPQTKRKGESATAFASRVKGMIAKTAGLNSVPWDGYLKYYKPRPEYLQSRKLTYAKMLRQRFGLDGSRSKTPSPTTAKKEAGGKSVAGIATAVPSNGSPTPSPPEPVAPLRSEGGDTLGEWLPHSGAHQGRLQHRRSKSSGN